MYWPYAFLSILFPLIGLSYIIDGLEFSMITLAIIAIIMIILLFLRRRILSKLDFRKIYQIKREGPTIVAILFILGIATLILVPILIPDFKSGYLSNTLSQFMTGLIAEMLLVGILCLMYVDAFEADKLSILLFQEAIQCKDRALKMDMIRNGFKYLRKYFSEFSHTLDTYRFESYFGMSLIEGRNVDMDIDLLSHDIENGGPVISTLRRIMREDILSDFISFEKPIKDNLRTHFKLLDRIFERHKYLIVLIISILYAAYTGSSFLIKP